MMLGNRLGESDGASETVIEGLSLGVVDGRTKDIVGRPDG